MLELLLDACQCQHSLGTHGVDGACGRCLCGSFSLDDHIYPLGNLVVS